MSYYDGIRFGNQSIELGPILPEWLEANTTYLAAGKISDWLAETASDTNNLLFGLYHGGLKPVCWRW